MSNKAAHVVQLRGVYRCDAYTTFLWHVLECDVSMAAIWSAVEGRCDANFMGH